MPADKADGEGQVLPARKAPLRPPRDPVLLAFWARLRWRVSARELSCTLTL